LVVVGAAVHRAPRGGACFAGMKADRRVATGLREENGLITDDVTREFVPA
jgi:hypothetical protein